MEQTLKFGEWVLGSFGIVGTGLIALGQGQLGTITLIIGGLVFLVLALFIIIKRRILCLINRLNGKR